jgi:uncharacterized protein YecE (DUF72 family)
MILVGTSGWQYRDWKGRFYPKDLPQRRWLEFFSQHFPTVEVNNSFYRLPSEETFARWRKESAEGFVVAVKASRFITHIRRLRDCADPVALFWSRATKLGPKLGPVLFQLPPNFRADTERLREFVSVLPKEMKAAFEFRDRSWESEEVWEILDRAGVAYVLADRPGARIRDVVTGGWSYIRFHQGGHGPAGADYTRAKLRRWAERIARLPSKDVFAYFNNDPTAAAVRDAVTLTELLEGRGQDVARARIAASQEDGAGGVRARIRRRVAATTRGPSTARP